MIPKPDPDSDFDLGVPDVKLSAAAQIKSNQDTISRNPGFLTLGQTKPTARGPRRPYNRRGAILPEGTTLNKNGRPRKQYTKRNNTFGRGLPSETSSGEFDPLLDPLSMPDSQTENPLQEIDEGILGIGSQFEELPKAASERDGMVIVRQDNYLDAERILDGRSEICEGINADLSETNEADSDVSNRSSGDDNISMDGPPVISAFEEEGDLDALDDLENDVPSVGDDEYPCQNNTMKRYEIEHIDQRFVVIIFINNVRIPLINSV